MTILPHIKIEKRIAVWERKRRGGNKIVAACRMKGKKMIAGITGSEPCGQCSPDRKLFDVVYCAVTTDDPYEISLPVACPYEFPIIPSVSGSEDPRTDPMCMSDLVTPSRQNAKGPRELAF